ncbi:hypothetical protein AB0J72_20235 [Dactylosporangium sp. NPDC049742]|uniref:hypothetical protein n=1 Tax=Dactylosporangium sp. NPDC049742 TaxID=3154737 RepID=UPI00342B2DC9
MTGASETLHIKHLEFLQGVIDRMSTMSFLVKGWLVTMTTALLAVSAERGSWLVGVSALLPLIAFWGVDGFLLRQERLYRRLYDAVRRAEDDVEPLSMNATRYRSRILWPAAVGSPTLVAFYGGVALVDLVFVVLAAFAA